MSAKRREEAPVTILCFGNPFIKGDSAAQKVSAMEIPGAKLVPCNSAEELMFYLDLPFAIMDAVPGAKKAAVIDSTRVLHSGRISSLHDFDLGYFLKLMAALEPKRRIPIVALPPKITPSRAVRQMTLLMPELKRRLRA